MAAAGIQANSGLATNPFLSTTNPFLSGNWRPASPTPAGGLPAALCSGMIPKDLRGSFLRIGPNASPRTLAAQNHEYYHFFNGDGFVVGVEFGAERVSCRCRFVETHKFKTGREMVSRGERSGLANTALVLHHDRLLSLAETAKPYEISLPSLQTLGRYTFGDKLTHNFTAHPKVCPISGELICFGYNFGEEDIQYSVFSPQGHLLRPALGVPFRQPVFSPTPHDMGITRNYSILLDFPFWNMQEKVKVEDGTLFGVMPRHATHASQVCWFRTDGQMGFHVAMAFEVEHHHAVAPDSGRDGVTRIHMVVCTTFDYSFKKSNRTMVLRQWTMDVPSRGRDGQGRGAADNPIPIASGKVLSPVPCDFPVVDTRRIGLPCRYIWASMFSQRRRPAPIDMEGILRHDMVTGQTTTLTHPGGRMGGECSFVPRRYANGRRGEEGDGYLVLHAYRPGCKDDLTDVLIYNATFGANEKPLAIVTMPTRVPSGFHALWVDEEDYIDQGESISWYSNVNSTSRQISPAVCAAPNPISRL